MNKRLLLKNALVVDPSQNINSKNEVLINGGKIEKISGKLEAGEEVQVVDLEGKVLVPGFVDIHVHLREPGQEEKETIASGSRAAAAGGITSLCCMPNTSPPADNRQTVKYVQERACRAGMSRIYPVGTLTLGQRGEELTSFGALLTEGVKAFSEDGKTVASSSVMYNALCYLRKFDVPVISHCEEESLSEGGEAHDGYWANIMGLQGLPAVAEELAVVRDILLARETGARLHLAHVSLAETVGWVRWAKEQGVRVTAEVTPHHLLLNDACLQGYNTLAKMKPPLRTEKDRQALVQGLQSGVIDAIATDHAPHCREDKNGDFSIAAFGVSGLETVIPLLLTYLVKPGMISLEQLVSSFCVRPAEIVGLPGGTLAEGAPADITVLDLEAPGEIDSAGFYSKGKNTPFEGWSATGKPLMTIVGGEIKMKDGKILEHESR